MNEIELLNWQFRIAKMDRAQLETTVREMVAPDNKPFNLDSETMARLERLALIGNTEAILNRAPSGGGSGTGKPKKTSTLDLHGYYEALNVEEKEAQDRADRAAIRVMCERRLAHMRYREHLRYIPVPSPLKAFIAARSLG